MGDHLKIKALIRFMHDKIWENGAMVGERPIRDAEGQTTWEHMYIYNDPLWNCGTSISLFIRSGK